MRVTIRDVAREAGVSDTTVSLALRPKSRISDATRQRVLEAAQRLSYVPDRAAQRLRTGASRALGFLVNDLTNPFYARMIRRAGEVARDRAYELTVGESRWDPARELTAAQHMIEARVDGMLACLTERNTETLQRFGQYGVPAVLVDTYPEGYSGAYVANDLIAAGRLAAAHLAEAGCRRLVMFSAQARGRRFSAMRRLEAGFAEGARAAGLRFDRRKQVIPAGLTIAEGRTAWQRLTANHPGEDARPDGVFCVNDLCAYGVMDAADAEGLVPGRDLAIAGVDDLPPSALRRIGLTSIRQPVDELVERATHALLDAVESGEAPTVRVTLPPELVPRASTNLC